MRPFSFLWLVISSFVCTFCKTSEPSATSVPRTINYSQYVTYDFGNAAVASSQNPAFSWPQFKERIEQEVSFVLPGKGLEKDTRSPDLLIYYYALVSTERNVPLLEYNIGWAAEPFITSGERFSDYPDHTFVIDFVDTNINQLIWRGSTALPFDQPDRLYEVLPKRIHSLIGQYPTIPRQ